MNSVDEVLNQVKQLPTKRCRKLKRYIFYFLLALARKEIQLAKHVVQRLLRPGEAYLLQRSIELNCVKELIVALASYNDKIDEGSQQGRTTSWRKLIDQHRVGFIKWLDTNKKKVENLNRLTDDLEKYLHEHVFLESHPECHSICNVFANALPLVLSKCDEDIYDQPFVADAYAFVHLLGRYRRFWDVLETLTQYKVLPMRDTGIGVLDVGTGPAPTSYATQDFYKELFEYAKQIGCHDLITSEPRIDCVESSYGMQHLSKTLSTFGNRRGPNQAIFDDLGGLDLSDMRLYVKDQIINDALNVFESSTEAEWWSNNEETWWKDAFRYNLCIFSNFLTTPESVNKFQMELKNIFWSIKPGGIVVVIGGTKKQYPQIYSMIIQVALDTTIKHLNYIPSVIPCDYSDKTAERIKDLYRKVTGILKSKNIDLSQIDNLPKDLWDDNSKLKGPNEFGLLVFRKGR